MYAYLLLVCGRSPSVLRSRTVLMRRRQTSYCSLR